MDNLLNRYRNLTYLLALLLGQLLLLAWQVKSNQDARLIRVWAVTAVTPLARATEWGRAGAEGLFSRDFRAYEAVEENQRLRAEVGTLRLQNHYLQTQLQTADRAKALLAFQIQTPSKTLPARVIATGTGMNSRSVYIDRGTTAGVQKGMAVLRPEGIVGKVVAAYPTASLVTLITEQGFAAGVLSQKNRVRGTLRGLGSANLSVDYIQNEQKVELGEWFYTSGDDRIFPKGLPVGMAVSVKEGRGGKEIVLQPFALKGGVEEVLVVLDGVHGEIPPPSDPGAPEIRILPAPPPDAVSVVPPAAAAADGSPATAPLSTEADRLVERYRRLSESQGHVIGQTPGRAPDFNRPVVPRAAPAATPPPAGPPAAGQEPPAATPPKPAIHPPDQVEPPRL